MSLTVDQFHARSRLRGSEVLVSLVGSIGRVAVAQALSGANIAEALAKITPGESISSRWIAFALRAPQLQDWMAHGARGVARNTLNLSVLARAQVPAPARKPIGLRQIEIRQAGLRSVRQKLADSWSC